MSTSPGVTYNPEASTVLVARDSAILAATAAIFPPLIPMSRMALRRFLPSTTWPPLIRRSNSVWPYARSPKERPTRILVKATVILQEDRDTPITHASEVSRELTLHKNPAR